MELEDPSAVKEVTKPKEGFVFIVQNMRNVQAGTTSLTGHTRGLWIG